jgi:hypothetical protein
MSFVFYSWKKKPHCSKLATAKRLFCSMCKANIVLGSLMCVRVLFQGQLRPALTVAACFWLEPRPHQTKANYLFEKLVYLMVHVSTDIDTECCFSCLKRNNHVTSHKGIKRESSRYRHSKLILNMFLSADDVCALIKKLGRTSVAAHICVKSCCSMHLRLSTQMNIF